MTKDVKTVFGLAAAISFGLFGLTWFTTIIAQNKLVNPDPTTIITFVFSILSTGLGIGLLIEILD